MTRTSNARIHASLESLETRQLLTTLALFYNNGYVDTSTSDGTPASATNLRAELTGLGYAVNAFTGLDPGSVQSALQGADVVVIPDLSKGVPAFSNAARDVIRSFVNGGGGYLSAGDFGHRDTTLMQDLFGYAAFETNLDDRTQPLVSAAAAGTAFAGGPATVHDSVGAYAVYGAIELYVPSAKSIYSYTGSFDRLYPVVAALPYASRYPVVFLGRDWSRGGPSGTEDGNWKAVLDRSVKQVQRKVVPAAPSNLAASTTSSSRIDLSWQDNSDNETGFAIERSTSATTSFVRVGTVAAGVHSYSSTGLAAGQKYYYRVQTLGSGGNSGYSGVASATTSSVGNPTPTPVPVGVPATPTRLAVTANSASQSTLSWTASTTNVSNILIERAVGTSGTFQQIASTGASTTTYVDTALTANFLYRYRIRAKGPGGTSAYSAIAAVTMPPAPFAILIGRKLTLTGTDRGNTISVSPAGSELVFGLDGQTATFAASKIGSITIFAGAGNDRVTIASAVAGARVEGGFGNDRLNGGAGDDTLFGQNGKDTITGGGGSDYLDGGKQNDTIYAAEDAGRDTLSGGAGKDRGSRDAEDVVSQIELLR